MSPSLDQGHFLFSGQGVSTIALHDKAAEGSRGQLLSRMLDEPSHLKAAAQGSGPHPRSPPVISYYYIPSGFEHVIMHMLLHDRLTDFPTKLLWMSFEGLPLHLCTYILYKYIFCMYRCMYLHVQLNADRNILTKRRRQKKQYPN